MKRRVMCILLVFIMTAVSVPAGVYGYTAEDSVEKVYISAEYGQTGARSMLKMINDFRTGDEAWAYDSDNKKVHYKNLEKLSYDYRLEEIAMERAAEIAVKFSHERTDGRYELEDEVYGENIAAGTPYADEIFDLWQETSEPYEGQGHRRNMLGAGYTSVGIGHVRYQGVDYWVQEFGISRTGAEKTEPCNSVKKVPLRINTDYLDGKPTVTIREKEVSVKTEKTARLPLQSITFAFPETWGYEYARGGIAMKWYSENENIARVEGRNVIGVNEGKTRLAAYCAGKKYVMNVKVILSGDWTDGGKRYLYTNNTYAKGLREIDGKTYYFDKDGYMQKGRVSVSGRPYYFSRKTGEAADKGWIYNSEGKKMHYCYGNGKLATGKHKIGNYTYFLDEKGYVQYGKTYIEGKPYYFSRKSAAGVRKGWISNSEGKKTYYCLGSGKLATGKHKIGNYTYFLNEKGYVQYGKTYIEGKPYYFSRKSAAGVRKGWISNSEGKKTYYCLGSGKLATGKVKINGRYYRFNSKGYLQ